MPGHRPDFSASRFQHRTYTREEPNSLSAEELPQYLDAWRVLYPQHYAYRQDKENSTSGEPGGEATPEPTRTPEIPVEEANG